MFIYEHALENDVRKMVVIFLITPWVTKFVSTDASTHVMIILIFISNTISRGSQPKKW